MPEQIASPLSPINAHDFPEQVDPAGRSAVCPLPGTSAMEINMMTDVATPGFMETHLQHIRNMDAIGTIASGIAHNFRNTLNEILINSQVLQLTYKDTSELKQITDRIDRSVKRGARLVDGLLQFSGHQSNESFQMLDLTGVLKEAYELTRNSYDHKIDIRIELPPSLPVMGLHDGLSQALINLCNNARDAMPNGGVLSIMARRVDNKVVVIIADNGVGMDPATVKKCFEPFFTTKPVGKGDGLGLSATYGIIKSHNGRITLASEPGKGTRVLLQLPLAGENARIEATPRPKLVSDRGPQLEVVEKTSTRFNTCRACLMK